jgi:cobalt-zinc-cadmium efflux system protein
MASLTHAHDHDDHDHDHPHGHHHHAPPAAMNGAFMAGIVINLAYMVIEIAAGLFAHSIALLADAAHNASDVAGLLAAYIAGRLAMSAASATFTYGKRRASILSALGNAVALLIVTGGIAWEAVLRLFHTPEVAGGVVMLIAAGGIVVNGGSALLFLRGQGDLNVRGAFLHLAGDAALAAATVVAGGLILLTHINVIDPLISLAVSGYMIWATWSLLRQAVGYAMDAVPPGLDTDKIEACLVALPGVISLHDLHVWPVSTTDTALTAHLIRAEAADDAGLLAAACRELDERFGIRHATLQLETEGTACVCVFV